MLERFKSATATDRLDMVRRFNNTGDVQSLLEMEGLKLSAVQRSSLKAQLKALRVCEAAVGNLDELHELTGDSAIAARPGCVELLTRLIREAQ